ncbi:M48 family metallopeptidase [Motiliproteus sp. SC1-56]|uniref:M48 family metallopeptidase n=1 Tax=Motiliproteus sp. SC1-56 TaxID=2799565 RepID=UPI001A8C6181|nr:M48 family metallopeptidase [Motiliproteus sp. SC1-56]
MLTSVLLASVVLTGCAGSGSREWPRSGLVSWEGQRVVIPGDLVLQTQRIFARLRQESGQACAFRIGATPVPNAFVSQQAAGPLVVLNAGLLDLIGYDRDALAFVLAHELAHLSEGHLRQVHHQRRAERDSTAEVLGTLVDFIIPLGGLVVEAGYAMMEAGYSRDDERAADRVGLALMTRAGFDPRGALRFQRRLAQVSDRRLPFFSTHPSGEERIQNLQRLIEAQLPLPGSQTGSAR